MKTMGKTDLLDMVKAFIASRRMIQRTHCVLAAVSGGPDSTALLHVLHRLQPDLGFRVVAAHLDHRLRDDSALDAAFTRETARSLGVDCVVRAVDVRSLAADRKISVEEAGRYARYAFLEEAADSMNAQVITTAHHMDDEVETFFLRIFRGSSPKGMRGIAPVRGRIVRPLLCVTREEIMAFLESEGISYRIDPTNRQDDTDRNFVRNRLIPVIRERFPDFRKPLRRSMDLIEREERVLDDLASKIYAAAVSRTDSGLSVNVPILRSAAGALAARAIVSALYELSGPHVRWARTHVDAILEMARSENPSGEIHLPNNAVVYRQYDRLLLSRGTREAPQSYLMTVSGPGVVYVPAAGMLLNFRVVGREEIDPFVLNPTVRVVFDAAHVPFPLTVRGPRPGDRFRPWGTDETRKLKKMLIDAKVPLRIRKELPLVLKMDEILWIPGVRRSRFAPVTPETALILEMSIVE